MVVLRNADGSLNLLRVVVFCGVVRSLVTVASALEASGQGESTYEEYDDEGPYHREFELPDEEDEGLERFDERQYDVLDPITDDDISYSGYYDEMLDIASASPPVPDGNESFTGADVHVLVRDGQHALEHSATGSREPVAPSSETTLNPIALAPPEIREDVGADSASDGNVPAFVASDAAQTSTTVSLDTTTCVGHKKLPQQPVFTSASENFIRKCCPEGERLVQERSILFICRNQSSLVASSENPSSTIRDDGRNIGPQLGAIVAQFYDGCIEDLEEDLHLGINYGNPCSIERGLVSFGSRTNDTLYVIQNGSLLVIYGVVEDYDIFDSYCLDYDPDDGTVVAYVCPADVKLRMDIIAGQLFVLNLCLIFAIPLLLITAALYMIIPDLHDLHGRALAMNCVNFAIALLLECFFQHRTRGKRMVSEEMVLENYAEYFILATFLWLLVNCANNCFHVWFYTPQAKDVSQRWENRRFMAYAAVAQLLPLWIILSFSSTPNGNPAIKHYFFRPIMLILVLTLICLIVCYKGLRRLKSMFYMYYVVRERLQQKGNDFNDEEIGYTKISGKKINKVIYMTNYTAMLYVVMAMVWTIMTVTYYSTYELPIFYDILFGLQGILMFLIFVCLPRPFNTVQTWFRDNHYWRCCCHSKTRHSPCATCEPMPAMRRGLQQEMIQQRAIEHMKADKGWFRKNPLKYLPEVLEA